MSDSDNLTDRLGFKEPRHFVSATCEGERCRRCGKPATHKVGEELAPDAPRENTMVHNLTAYMCCEHFAQLMGRAALCDVEAQYGKVFTECRSYDELRHQLSGLPDTWYPDLICAMVRAATLKKVFKLGPEGLPKLVQNEIDRTEEDTP